MQIYDDFHKVPIIPNPILTVGVFDGVHLGHQQLFSQLKKIAKDQQGQTIVLTFDRNPLEVLAPKKAPKVITDISSKINLIAEQHIDHLLIQPFSLNFAELTAKYFVEKILIEKLQINTIVIGPDFHFGKDRQGNLEYLRKSAKLLNFSVIATEFLSINNIIVSSTEIRRLIEQNQIDKASSLLGWDYSQYLNHLN